MDRRKLEYYIGVTEELETFVRDADDSAEDDYNDRMGDFGNFQDTPLHRKHILLLGKIRGLRQFIKHMAEGNKK